MVSERYSCVIVQRRQDVLILVIAVDGLGEPVVSGQLYNSIFVLILVIAVDGLGAEPKWLLCTLRRSLNPCYSGRWSRRGSSQIPL